MAEQAYWYVVHTYSGYENKVATDLMTMVENRRIQDLICDVKVPTETVMEDQFDKTGNKIGEKEVQRKIYPGYVFVKMVMNDNTWYIVRNTRGCTGFVGPESKPVPLTEEEVRKLGVEKVTVEVHYAVGDLVNVIDGPLEGFSGTVDAIDIPNNSAQVTVSMFGRETSVDFELDQLEKVKD
jgi:transcriptional antiterminator NusG